MSENNSQTQAYLSWTGNRVRTAYDAEFLSGLWQSEKTNYVSVLGNSAFAANNTINVGMTETAEVLNAMLTQPGNEQIYTTQPQWTFVEDDENVAEQDRTYYQLGSTWTDTSVTPNVVYPIPSIIYDINGGAHVVFPVWQYVGQFVNKYVNSAGIVSDTEQTGYTQKKILVGQYLFKPMRIAFKKNCNWIGGNLDGFEWQEVSVTSGSSVTVTGDAQTGFTASVPTTATVAVGTWVRLTYTESDASKTAYGYVSAVGEDEVTVTVVGVCGTTVTKVELYKPLQG